MKRYFLLGCIIAITPICLLFNRYRRTPRIWASRPLLELPLMCHVRLIGPAAPVGVGAAAAAAVFLRLLRRAVAAAVGAAAVGGASNGAAATGVAVVVVVVGMAVVGVWLVICESKKLAAVEIGSFDRRQRAARSSRTDSARRIWSGLGHKRSLVGQADRNMLLATAACLRSDRPSALAGSLTTSFRAFGCAASPASAITSFAVSVPCRIKIGRAHV